MQHDAARAVDQQTAQVLVAPFADPQQHLLAAAGVLARHQPERGGNSAPAFVGTAIADMAGKHAGDNRTVAGQCLQAADLRVLAAVRFDLARVGSMCSSSSTSCS